MSLKVLAIIQARLNSKRFPGKVLEHVDRETLVDRVKHAAEDAKLVDKVVVAWGHEFPHLEINNVLGRFLEISDMLNPGVIVRLTADCPLLTAQVIDEAVKEFYARKKSYYCNRDKYRDGFDVQVFKAVLLNDSKWTHLEHVIHPRFVPHVHDHYLSVDIPKDLERVRAYYCDRLVKGESHG